MPYLNRVSGAFLGGLILASTNSAMSQNALQHPLLNSPGSVLVFQDNELRNGIANKSIFALKTKWDTDGDGITRIPVCWENPRTEHQHFRDVTKTAVTGTWQLYSSIQFLNWGACTAADTTAIHISVGDYWPQSGIGKQSAGQSAGMQLNFDFNAPVDWQQCKPIAESCVYKLGVHEFGHALGFLHEQVRADTPDNCRSAQPGEKKVSGPGYTTSGTPWDIDSVMNYCNPVWNNSGHLSNLDVLALQSIYGSPRH